LRSSPTSASAFLLSEPETCHSAFVKSFGRRLAYESPRGTNPRCVARGLWGFEELLVRGVAELVLTWLLGIAVWEVLPGDRGTDRGPRVGKVAGGVWDKRA
jgi:hypothetical protein